MARRFGLLGDPVGHSPSPAMYRAAFARLGLDATYETVRVPAGRTGELSRAMHSLAAGGGGNITAPHKEAAARLVRTLPLAARTGACNCFWRGPSGDLTGDNTDVGGFARAVGEIEGLDFGGATVLLLGAGGAARAVAVACADAGVRRLTICNRDTDRARGLVSDLGLAAVARVVERSQLRGLVCDVAVNATNLGLRPDDPLPMALDDTPVKWVFDLVYGPDGTSWTRHARSAGIPAVDGASMLVHQACLGLQRWLGVDEIGTEVTEAMSAVVRGILRSERE